MCSITLNNAQAKFLFKPRIDYDTGDEPRSVAIGDFNRDANPDLAVTNGGSDNVSILINTGGYGDELAADFGTNGLWNYDGTSWSKKTPWHCENMGDVDLN